MLPNLTANEVRVLGCLMEKSVVTPNQYPMTLNALTNACNQKSSRNPVMALDPGTVRRTLHDLAAKHLVSEQENFKRGVEKFKQRFCNTAYSDYTFDPPQFAVMCLLFLRGPQTPGELRARSGRLHVFPDNSAVVDALTELMEREGDSLVVKLPRTPGRKDAEYMHLFSGPIDVQAQAIPVQATKPAESTERVSVAELAWRVTELEAEVAELKAQLKSEG